MAGERLNNMKLIIGLGNPGEEYKYNRHNIGFIILDMFLSEYKDNFSEFKYDKKLKSEIAIGNIAGEKVILAKPKTFMNKSGDALSLIMNFYKIDIKDIIILQDDKDLEFAKIRIRDESSAGGHNGIKSIISAIGTNKIKRLKFGIANERLNFMPTDAFVLENFSKEEMDKIYSKKDEIVNLLYSLL